MKNCFLTKKTIAFFVYCLYKGKSEHATLIFIFDNYILHETRMITFYFSIKKNHHNRLVLFAFAY